MGGSEAPAVMEGGGALTAPAARGAAALRLAFSPAGAGQWLLSTAKRVGPHAGAGPTLADAGLAGPPPPVQAPSRRPAISAAVSATKRPHSGSRASSYRESGMEMATVASGVPSSSRTGAAIAQTSGRYWLRLTE